MLNHPAPPHPTVLLLWLRSSLPSFISTNVLREVHFYLLGPYLGCLYSDGIVIFDVGQKSWKQTIILNLLRNCRPLTFILLSPRDIFMCGLSTPDRNSSYVVNLKGEVLRMGDMLLSGVPGLFFNQGKNEVLAFGGGDMPASRTEAQTYSLSTRKWEFLESKMHHPRCYFTPCQYLHYVYLISPNTPHIERYSLKTGTFTLIGEGNQCVPELSQAVVYNRQVYLYFNTKCEIFDIYSGKFTSPLIFPKGPLVSSGFAVVNQELVTIDYPCYWVLNLQTGSSYRRKGLQATGNLHYFTLKMVGHLQNPPLSQDNTIPLLSKFYRGMCLLSNSQTRKMKNSIEHWKFLCEIRRYQLPLFLLYLFFEGVITAAFMRKSGLIALLAGGVSAVGMMALFRLVRNIFWELIALFMVLLLRSVMIKAIFSLTETSLVPA